VQDLLAGFMALPACLLAAQVTGAERGSHVAPILPLRLSKCSYLSLGRSPPGIIGETKIFLLVSEPTTTSSAMLQLLTLPLCRDYLATRVAALPASRPRTPLSRAVATQGGGLPETPRAGSPPRMDSSPAAGALKDYLANQRAAAANKAAGQAGPAGAAPTPSATQHSGKLCSFSLSNLSRRSCSNETC